MLSRSSLTFSALLTTNKWWNRRLTWRLHKSPRIPNLLGEVGLLQLEKNAHCPLFMAKFDGPHSCFQKTQHIKSHRVRGHGPRALAFDPVVQHEVSPKETARLAKACRPFFGCVPRAGLTSFRRKRNKQFGTVFLLVKRSELQEPKNTVFTTSRSHLPYPNNIRKSRRHLFFRFSILFFSARFGETTKGLVYVQLWHHFAR